MQDKIKIKQLYDEEGNPFYPLTHVDALTGDLTKISRIGSTTKVVDLSDYICKPFVGLLTLTILNNCYYVYTGNITYTEGGKPMTSDSEYIVAKEISEDYRSILKNIQFASCSGVKDRVNMWLDTEGNIKAVLTAKTMDRGTNFDKYRSSVSSLRFTGVYMKNKLEDLNYGEYSTVE